MAAHVDGVRRARARRRSRRGLPRAVPERLGDGRAEGAQHADHRRARGLAARRVLRRRRSGWRRRAGGPAARFNVAIRTVTVDGESGLAEYGVGGGITWDSRAGSEYEEAVAKARVLTERRPGFELLGDAAARARVRAAAARRHLERLRGSAAYFGFTFDERAVREALDAEAAAAARPSIASGSSWTGPAGSPPPRCRWRRRPSRPGWRSTTCRSIPATCCCSTRRRRRERYEAARARHPDADDVLLVNTGGEVTESTIANVAAYRGALDHAAPRRRAPAGTERAALIAEGTIEEGTLRPDRSPASPRSSG